MNLVEPAAALALSIIGFSILMIFVRLLIGPSIEDRIVALDLLSANAIAFIAVYSINNRTTAFVDVGIVLALLAFLGTVGFAFYLERRGKQ